MNLSLKNKNIFKFLLFFSLLGLAMILSFSTGYTECFLDGIKLWAFCVLPSTFPYLIITSFLDSLNLSTSISKVFEPFTKRVFNVNGNGFYALFMSIISGYPIGAKITSDLYKKGLLSQTESIRCSCFSSHSSPMFLTATIGVAMFHNIKVGIIILISQITISFLIGIIFSFYKRNDKATVFTSNYEQVKSENLFYETVYSSVVSCLVVGGIIVIFYMLTDILTKIGVLSPLITLFSNIFGNQFLGEGFVKGIFEYTNGVNIISQSKISPLSIMLTCFLCAFGGLSINFQAITFLKNAKIKIAHYFISKIISAIFNSLFSLMLYFIFF